MAKDKKAAAEAYAQHKEKAAARQSEQSKAGRDITPLPPVVDPERKAACSASLRLHCETYHAEWFNLAWSESHLSAIGRLEGAAIDGGQFAFAMPRGSGKTTLCVAAAIWATINGHRRFVAMIGAEESHAVELIDSYKEELETNDLLAEDYPEVCYPIRRLEGINHRAAAQTLDGVQTRMEWSGKIARLPTVPGSAASGARVKIAGITGRVRGMKAANGRQQVRPDFCIVDDPQTDDSAVSLTQNDAREKVLTGAVLGLAGPKQKIAAVMPCTVIAAGDMADRILDRDRNPQWHGERTRMVITFPTNDQLWERYLQIRREDLFEGGDGAKATEFYRTNQTTMDAGAEVYWKERFNADELSALQSAMNLRQDRPKVFWAEFQNLPQTDVVATSTGLTSDLILSKCNAVPRGVVPKECGRLTLGVDVGLHVLWWTLTAWDENFGGSVIDYGCWPNQNRAYFAASDARPTLQDAYPTIPGTAVIYRGLADLTAALLGRDFPQAETGSRLKIDRVCIDAGYESDVVYQFCRESPHSALITPTFGRAVTTGLAIADWPTKDNERKGWHWRYTRPKLTFDPNMWKTFLADRWKTPLGGKGRLAIFGSQPVVHQLFAAHIASEFPTAIETRGRSFETWARRPSEDNHWLDTVVLGAIGVSFAGLTWSASGEVVLKAKKKSVSLAELRNKAQGGKA